jgi:hypothetical protein
MNAPSAPLAPLPTPEAPWLTVGLDFVTELPLCEGKDSVMVVVDHFSPHGSFLAMHKGNHS